MRCPTNKISGVPPTSKVIYLVRYNYKIAMRKTLQICNTQNITKLQCAKHYKIAMRKTLQNCNAQNITKLQCAKHYKSAMRKTLK
jgi:hypothetical protein